MRACPLHQWILRGTSASPEAHGSSLQFSSRDVEQHVIYSLNIVDLQQVLNQILLAIRLPQDKFDDYLCLCDDGYFGRDCEFEIDECAPGPCQNGATCVDLVADYRCVCLPDYTVGRWEKGTTVAGTKPGLE